MKITINMKVKNMYEFLMRHAYYSFIGIASLAFSILAFIYLCVNFSSLTTGKMIAFIVASLLFTVINPIWLYVTAGKQVKLSPTFKDELIYEINKEGIKVVQNDQELPIEWEDVQKVIETRNNITIYISRARAFVIPKEDVREQKDELKEMIKEFVDPSICRFKQA
ncbi:MAG: YcxB family protein [bacterium]|nr:YcxB family protein [bacterium]